jgi:hypothetical protein
MGGLNVIIVVARVRKIAKSKYKRRHVCPSVRPSACHDLAPTGQIFMKLYIGEYIFKNMPRKCFKKKKKK